MRYLASLLCAIALVTPLRGQQPRWEYGRLSIRDAMGMPAPIDWSAGDSMVSSAGLIRAFEQRERAGPKHDTDPLVGVMNELSVQGWEFVQAVPTVGLIFRRQRQP